MIHGRRSRKLTGEALWDFALRALAARAHSAAELERKLIQRAEVPSDVTSVMGKLREYGMIDDKAFSESFAGARLANEGFGRMRVLRDLRAKRVPAAIAEKAVTKTFADTDERELIEAYLARKYRGRELGPILAEEKGLAAVYRRLRLAGFSSGKTLEVLRRHSSRVNEFDLSEAPEEE